VLAKLNAEKPKRGNRPEKSRNANHMRTGPKDYRASGKFSRIHESVCFELRNYFGRDTHRLW